MNPDLINEFLASLDEKECIAYNIAKSHLGTLFSLDKSNAYLEWCFTRACKLGDLQDAKTAIQMHSGVDIFDGFICACKNGHLNVAEWLYETNPNEKGKFKKTFDKCLNNCNHKHIIEYLSDKT